MIVTQRKFLLFRRQLQPGANIYMYAVISPSLSVWTQLRHSSGLWLVRSEKSVCVVVAVGVPHNPSYIVGL